MTPLAPAESVQLMRTTDPKNAQRAEIGFKKGTPMTLNLEPRQTSAYEDIEIIRQGALTVIRSAGSLALLESTIAELRQDTDIVIELFTEHDQDSAAIFPEESEA